MPEFIPDTQTMASRYVERGWAVVLLHDVCGGTCSCGSTDLEHVRKQGGKHPVDNAWQNHSIRTQAGVRDAWGRRPGGNVGIVTGEASGVWVLDVDPLNRGHLSLAELIAAHGPLPETYTAPTGSGGTHYFFDLPDFEVRNRVGFLPGLDVRGRGGQVVAHPSRSTKGPYGEPHDVPTCAGPAWLLDLIRPADRPVSDVALEGGVSLEVGPQDLERGRAYAKEAAGRVLWELANAQPGTRNDTAFKVACRLAELVAAPWAGLVGSEVGEAYMRAAAQADTDGAFSQHEAASCLAKGVRHVDKRPAVLPESDHGGTWEQGWGLPPDFSRSVQMGAGLSTIGDSAASLTNAVSSAVEPIAGSLADRSVATEVEIAYTMRRLDAQRVAAERIAARDESRVSFLERMLIGRQVHSLPKPVALIEGWLYRDTLARVWGPSGDYKSFVALDMACSVSTGRAWHGNPVRRGRVAYVVAEGASGAGLRYEAWIERHGDLDPLLCWFPMAVQVLGGEWAQFIRDMVTLQPDLIIIDTQARATVGVEENSSKEAGMVVDALEGLRQATGACVLLVHHTGTAGDRARGSTAIKGAMNTEIAVKKARGLVTVANPKQKDGREADDLTLAVTAVGESVALLSESSVGADGFTDPAAGWARQSSADREAATLANMLVDGYAGSQGVTRAQALAEFVKLEPMLDSKTVRNRKQGQVWARLERLGRLAQNPMSSGKFLFLEIPDLPLLAANPDPVEFGWPQAKAPSKETSDRAKDLETE